MVDIPRLLGALLVGAIVAAIFSGVVSVQTLAYFKFYPNDHQLVKTLVLAVWFLDFWHTIFITISLWYHLIAHFGDVDSIDYIPWSLALTIAFTAVLTFLVHAFFVQRIYKLSKNNLYLSIPLALLACARLAFACLTTAKMMSLRSLKLFVKLYTWSFTTGLALSAILDILITASMCFLLHQNRKKDSSMNDVLDKLMLYAFENGSLTCAATFISLICWLTMPQNLIFMGLHFVISKFYANSLLATLNMRMHIKRGSSRSISSGSNERGLPVFFPDGFRMHRNIRGAQPTTDDNYKRSQVQINIEKTTVCTIDKGSPEGFDTL